MTGTCQSVGCTVDGSHPHDLIDRINAGEMEVPDVSTRLAGSVLALQCLNSLCYWTQCNNQTPVEVEHVTCWRCPFVVTFVFGGMTAPRLISLHMHMVQALLVLGIAVGIRRSKLQQDGHIMPSSVVLWCCQYLSLDCCGMTLHQLVELAQTHTTWRQRHNFKIAFLSLDSVASSSPLANGWVCQLSSMRLRELLCGPVAFLGQILYKVLNAGDTP